MTLETVRRIELGTAMSSVACTGFWFSSSQDSFSEPAGLTAVARLRGQT